MLLLDHEFQPALGWYETLTNKEYQTALQKSPTRTTPGAVAPGGVAGVRCQVSGVRCQVSGLSRRLCSVTCPQWQVHFLAGSTTRVQEVLPEESVTTKTGLPTVKMLAAMPSEPRLMVGLVLVRASLTRVPGA